VDGWIYIELIERGWLELDRSVTFVRFTEAGADMFA
jgi:hypothetical protein